MRLQRYKEQAGKGQPEKKRSGVRFSDLIVSYTYS